MTHLLRTLRDPAHALGLDEGAWETLVATARAQRLLARLALTYRDQGLLGKVPDRPRRHLEWSAVEGESHARGLRWEVDRIRDAVAPLGRKIVLLKGAAYAMSGMPVARGRLVSDVDLLAAREDLPAIEEALRARGWDPVTHDEYYQHYYREWAHELPPMRHRTRASMLDVHHTILPPTGRLRPDASRLLANARPLAGHDGLWILDPLDLVLHCAAHLFQDSLDQGLRDLVDLHDLLRAHDGDVEFWERLPARARELDLSIPVHYALRYAPKLLGTPVPEHALEATARDGPSPRARAWMDRLVPDALTPHAPGRTPRATARKRWLLYLRSHYVRMPLPLLVRHAITKSFRNLLGRTDHAGAARE